MKGKVFMTLFALPFAGFGLFMLWLIGSEVADALGMHDWVPVEARVLESGSRRNSGDDSDTYEAHAPYRYYFNGQTYTGNRVAIAKGADNIGSYQTDMGDRLDAARRNEAPITVYVNPDQPLESIVDPNLRWGLIGFKSIFVLVFGGVGFGLLYAQFRTPTPKNDTEPQYLDSPWLMNDKWQSRTILSAAKVSMIVSWAFAGFWNLISAPLPFLLYEEVTQKDNYAALFGLLFPVVGIGLVVWAIRQTAEWYRFGPAPLTLDPFPGAIGGHVGGTIDLNLPYDGNNRFQLTLSNLRSSVSGSGKNRSRRESAKWQDKLVAHAEPGGKGTRLTFRFDVPEGLQPSDIDRNDSYHIWRLNVLAEIDGPDIDRDYEIPVFPTGQTSSGLSEHAVRKARAEQGAIDDASVIKAVRIEQGVYGKRIHFPAFRNFASNFVGITFGCVFAAAGAYLIAEQGEKFMGGVFAFVGGAIVVAALYMLLNSLTVTQDGMSIKTVRRILGIPVKRAEMRRDAFDRFKKTSSMQTQSGKRHTMHYKIRAVDREGNDLVIGESFNGENEANAAIRIFERELGLQSRDDVLASDS